MRFPARVKVAPSDSTPKSWRQHLLALSAFLAFLSLFAVNPQTVATIASLNETDPHTKQAFYTARERGLRPSIVLAYSQNVKLSSAEGRQSLASFLDNLEIATKTAWSSGLLVPSDRLLLELTLAIQEGLPPELAAELISHSNTQKRLARLTRYRDEIAQGLPPSSAVTRAVLIR